MPGQSAHHILRVDRADHGAVVNDPDRAGSLGQGVEHRRLELRVPGETEITVALVVGVDDDEVGAAARDLKGGEGGPGGGCGAAWRAWVHRARGVLLARLDRIYGADRYHAAMMRGLLLGDATAIELA